MATSNQSPQLQLTAGQVGGVSQLNAGLYEALTGRANSPNSYITIALFCGKRPSLEERRTGFYHFLGDSPLDQSAGVWRLYRSGCVEHAALPSLLRDGQPLNENTHSHMPADVSKMLSQEGEDLVHLQGRERTYLSKMVVGKTLRTVVLETGSGHTPTWGLVTFRTSGVDVEKDVFFVDPNRDESSNRFTYRHGNHALTLSTFRVNPDFSTYITVGDLNHEPTANLVLKEGAEPNRTEPVQSLRLHRLRIRAPKLVANPIGGR